MGRRQSDGLELARSNPGLPSPTLGAPEAWRRARQQLGVTAGLRKAIWDYPIKGRQEVS